ncbi:MAG: hypothetical protein RIM84_23750 [Alphaproteobacteria bacterium]
MPEIDQYSLSHKELLEILIKKFGVHEGRWALSMQFGIATGLNLPSPSGGPGLGFGVLIDKLGIQRAAGEPSGLVLDAAEVNPTPAESKGRRKKA